MIARGLVDEGLRPGLAPIRVNVAVNNDGTYHPRLEVSSIAEGSAPRMLADGVAWYLRSPPNRWASAEADGAAATVAVDFGTPRRVDEVRLCVLDDDPAVLAVTADAAVPGRDETPSPVRPPREIALESWSGSAWVPVATTRRAPQQPEADEDAAA